MIDRNVLVFGYSSTRIVILMICLIMPNSMISCTVCPPRIIKALHRNMPLGHIEHRIALQLREKASDSSCIRSEPQNNTWPKDMRLAIISTPDE